LSLNLNWLHFNDLHFLVNLQNFFSKNKIINNFDIHFIRVQKRFNKRRYARARVVSRPSFWGGSLLSSLALGMFWGSTTQFCDWVLSQAVVIDINVILFFIYILLMNRWLDVFATRKVRITRDNYKILNGRFFTLYKKFNYKIKWFN